jgi:hypothetical protein
MTYHMSRVMFWIEHRDVGFYATHSPRQLWMSPWAEYAILHLRLLWGDDCFSNLVQWWASVCGAVSVSLIIRRFDARPVVQAAGALAAASIPIGIVEATGTQTDYAAAAWLACFLYFLLQATMKESSTGYPAWIAAGASLGLGILTKAGIALFAAPFLAWMLVHRLRAGGLRRAAAGALIIGLTVCALNAPQMARNFALYGDPLGADRVMESPSAPAVAYRSASPAVILMNALRHASLHIGTRWPSVNQRLFDAISTVHGWLGLSVHDPQSTFQPGSKYFIPAAEVNENAAANHLHAVLFAVALIVSFPLARKHPGFRPVLIYGMMLAAGFLLFSANIRWQPWASRLHLPVFLIAAPFLAMVFASVLKGRLLPVLVVLLSLSATPYLFVSDSRPFLGERSVFRLTRWEAMFNQFAQASEDYRMVSEAILAAPCDDVGVVIGGDSWSYPLWVGLEQTQGVSPRVRAVGVTNETARYEDRTAPAPCAVVFSKPYDESRLAVAAGLRKAWEGDALVLFLP